MRNGWQSKSLGEVCRFIDYRGKTPTKTESGLRLITAKNVKMGFLQEEPMEFVAPGSYDSWMTRGIPKIGDVLFTTEAPLANVAQLDTDQKVVFAQRIIVLQPTANSLDRTFLKYLLLSDVAQKRIHDKGTGATVKGIKASLLKAIPIEFPPLADQQRIVATLDEAFDGIATAKANAEKNLQNARGIFASQLQTLFALRDSSWVERTIAECFKVRSGDFLPAKSMAIDGSIDVYGGNGVAGKHDQFNLSGSNVVIGRVGAKCGNVRLVCGDIWLTDNAFSITEYFQNFDLRFLTYLLNLKGLRSTANQSAQPVISYTTLSPVVLAFPTSVEDQRNIADKLDQLAQETQRLESLYQQKLTALAELKKSLLHEAFSGRL